MKAKLIKSTLVPTLLITAVLVFSLLPAIPAVADTGTGTMTTTSTPVTTDQGTGSTNTTTTTTTTPCIITNTLPIPETTTTPPVGETTIETILPDGTSAAFTVDQDGRLVNPYTLTTEDGLFTLTLDSGTKLSTSTGRMPGRIAITNVSPQTMTGNEAIIHIYEVTAYTEDGVPTHVDFAPPVLLTLNYNPAELPGNTTAVYLVYYNESLVAWTKMEPPPGYVAKPGELATLLPHLSKYGILVNAAPSVTVVPKSHILYWLIPTVIVLVILPVFLFIIIRRRRKS